MDGTAIRLDGVTKRFGDVAAVRGADLEVAGGEIVALLGPSGCGKTTLLRTIAGFERPDDGLVEIGGRRVAGENAWVPPEGRGVGMVFQDYALFPHLTVAENVGFGLPRRDRAQRVPALLALVDLCGLGGRYPHELSGGQQQRVALARALAPDPRLLLLDEPFASLDGPARVRLRREVRALLQTTGTPAILVTHDRTEALALGDTVAVVIGGRVRQVGPVSDVFSHPADAAIAASLGIEAVLPAQVAGSSGGMIHVAVGEVRLQVAEREAFAIGAAVYACVRAEDVTLETLSSGHASTRNHLAARVISIAS